MILKWHNQKLQVISNTLHEQETHKEHICFKVTNLSCSPYSPDATPHQEPQPSKASTVSLHPPLPTPYRCSAPPAAYLSVAYRASGPPHRHSVAPYPSAPQGFVNTGVPRSCVPLRASGPPHRYSMPLYASALQGPLTPQYPTTPPRRGLAPKWPAEAGGSTLAGERRLTRPPLREANPSSSSQARCYFSR